MYGKWMKSYFILAILLMPLVSLSTAACPWYLHNELYMAECGVVKEVPASSGVLANDPTATKVLDHESITIDPKYGTIYVKEDGSFSYHPSSDIRSGTYVTFNYKATNGDCDSKYSGLAKIQVSCKCRPSVPPLDPLPAQTTHEEIIEALEDAGVGCLGCGDYTPVFDLSKIPDGADQTGSYPYFVKCPGSKRATGIVTIIPGCEPNGCPDDGDLCTIEKCVGGECVSDSVVCIAMEGYRCCPDVGGCINTWRDPQNCGDCGMICDPGMICSGGTCQIDNLHPVAVDDPQ